MRRFIHGIICWYMYKSGGAFHHYPYGQKGRYVVIMNETNYHNYRENEV